ncbi:hypothetical protein AK830_g5983 [Neonectria ditissima]|uniref:ABC transporter n=1 Tax=Neonectria ditissima TaxID=78410 RepID=A0A0P7B2E6_9HYPO|nr:hypothetical protein AK830_g5983 [Neonectria ditissima]
MCRTVRAFSAAASALFLLVLPFRLLKLRRQSAKVKPGHHGNAKILLLLAVEAARRSGDIVELSFAITSLIACIGLSTLVFLEHMRSVKPADLAVVYVLVSLACSCIELFTTAVKRGVLDFPTRLLAASVCLKLALVVVESRTKKTILRSPQSQLPPEQLAGILSRTFFWWINPILANGNRSLLTQDSLPSLDHELSSKELRHRALQTWDQTVKPETRTTLPKVLVLSMLPHFLIPVIPRLFLIAFRYSQPVLISTAVRLMSQSSEQDSQTGYLVIAMAITIYTGLAVECPYNIAIVSSLNQEQVSKTWYQHTLNRLKMMIRGAVVGLINNKSLNQPSNGFDDGKAVTLMSTDTENVKQAASMFHETWAQAIEVIVGMTMLAREVGWVFPVPLVIIFFCSRMSRYLAKNLQRQQKAWSEATQERIAMTTSMLASMSNLKMQGSDTFTEVLIHDLRCRELEMAKKVRWMMVAYNASANALGIFSPIITFVLFAVVASFNGRALDAEIAFTTTALLGLVTHPANMIMSIVPQAIGSLAAFERIQDYLLQQPRLDKRFVPKTIENSSIHSQSVVCIEDLIVRTGPSTPPVLNNISLTIDRGSVVICSGPLGSGKTMLIKSILGEVSPASGVISVSSKRIACCEQSPWLPSGTLKEAICGFSPKDPVFYEQVLRLCCLDVDVLSLPDGDETAIGSRGLNLSGGQRQRVALARAVYSRCPILLLDDSFSALDGNTESQIVEHLLGPEGLLRTMGTTVFLTSNSVTHFKLADWLVILDNGKITYQGTNSDLKENPSHVMKVCLKRVPDASTVDQPQANKRAQSQSLQVAEAQSDLSRATGDFSLYGYYLRAVGLRNFLTLLLCTSCYSFFVTFPQFWLQKWTEAPASQTRFYIGGYLILSLLAWLSTNGSMSAPLSFFSSTDIGIILNRFSQDMQLVDKQLPPAILALSNQVFKLLVQAVLLFSAQKLMTLTIPVCVLVVYLIQRVYLRTSRQLRLLELEAHSAVFSSFLESVEGITTIRAFAWENKIEQVNIRSLDMSQQPSYILFCLQQWLGLVLDLMVAAIATGLITLAILIRETTTAGQIGLALNIVLVANTTLLGLVTSWTNMEMSLGAISRLKTLEADTPKEDNPSEDYVPEEAWPSSGLVEFDNVTVAYNRDVLALQNVTMRIPGGHHLFICGRTGSGKSTMLITLLRLLDLNSGAIKVDGVDISLVPRSLIRQKCFITITQQPFFLGQASLRFNLDPSGCLSDETIVAALQKTQLWSRFDRSSSTSDSTQACQVLRKSVSSLPPMSSGESQLFALARALLRLQSLNHPRNPSGSRISHDYIKPILLLDEATSSVDSTTESVMRRIIDEEFSEKGLTVIAITHRLSGLADSTKWRKSVVALLSEGKIEKIGGAREILGDELM